MAALPIGTGSSAPLNSAGRGAISFERSLNALAAIIFLAATIAAFWFIHRFAVNMVYYDQWTDVNVIRMAHSGTLTLGELWSQHNENRVFFPNLVVLVLAYTTHFNLVIEDYLDGVLWCMTAIILIAAHKRRSPSVPWIWYCPVGLVMLSFVPLGDTLFGYQLGWYLELLGLAAALYFLDNPSASRLGLFGAACAAVLGSFSSMSGLLIWVAGFVLLYLRRRTLSHILTWTAAALATTALYFANFDFGALGGSGSYITRNPLGAIKFFFATIGNVVGANSADLPGGGSDGVLVLGIAISAIALWGFVQGFRRVESAGAIGVALLVFGLIFVAFTTVGRAQYGLGDAVRYSVLELMIWVGAYFSLLESLTLRVDHAVLGWSKRLRSRRSASLDVGEVADARAPRTTSGTEIANLAAGVTMIGLMLLQVVLAIGGGYADSNGWYGEELAIADVTANIHKASDALVQTELGGYSVSFMRQMAEFANIDHLSLFDSSAAKTYAKEGLFPYLTTAIVAPLYGATVLKSVALKATDNVVGPAEVQFRVLGGSLNNVVIGVGKREGATWTLLWNTSTIPNGVYYLRSALVHDGNVVDQSDYISVTVDNPKSH